MCLIACALRADPRFELLLIANRDEFHARPAAPAGPQEDAPWVVGGRDLQAGGSWLQWSARGRLAAVTNVRFGLPDAGKPRSRGALVSAFVRDHSGAIAAADALAPIAAEFGRFNLLLWDGATLQHVGNHPRLHGGALADGIHAISNGALDDRWPKTQHAMALLAAWLDRSDPDAAAADFAGLFDGLADRRPALDTELPDTGVGIELERRLSPLFIADPVYGTRASTVVAVAPDGRWWFEERRFGPGGVAAGGSRHQGQMPG
jgi:uncharacterized protein with NRDE domain